MDPNATLRMIRDAIRTDDWDTAGESASDLLTWLRAGGFEPIMLPDLRVWTVTETTTGYMSDGEPVTFRTKAEAVSYARDTLADIRESGWTHVKGNVNDPGSYSSACAYRTDTVAPDLGRAVVVYRADGVEALEALAR